MILRYYWDGELTPFADSQANNTCPAPAVGEKIWVRNYIVSNRADPEHLVMAIVLELRHECCVSPRVSDSTEPPLRAMPTIGVVLGRLKSE